MAIRTLVVDDSILFRNLLVSTLKKIPGVEVVDTASNGRIALMRIRALMPDLVTLDIEMPEMNGLELLEALKQERHQPRVIILSSLTAQGGILTMNALLNGALDFVSKPEGQELEYNISGLQEKLETLIGVLLDRKKTDIPNPECPALGSANSPVRDGGGNHPELFQVADRLKKIGLTKKAELVVIGVSTGGPKALGEILPLIPLDLNVPYFLVQHIPEVFSSSLMESLQSTCSLMIRLGRNQEIAAPNTLYLAPGGKQMRIIPKPAKGIMIQITDDPPENNCKPAVDYLFRSAAAGFPEKTLAVILTGMGSDGTSGLALLKKAGCHVLAQDEETSVVFGMPKSAINAGVVDEVLPLGKIPERIAARVRGEKA